MGKLLTAIINILFPPRPHEIILQNMRTVNFSRLYRPGTFQSVIYLSDYSDSEIQACIVENKFQHNKRAAEFLGNILQKWTIADTKKTLFVPIPLGAKRKRTRMHNQTMSILQQVKPDLHIATTLLKRQKETAPQTKLNKVDRINNMKGAFVFNDQDFSWSDYEQVIIVDDVVTTGATLLAARAAVTPHVPSHILIRTLALSH